MTGSAALRPSVAVVTPYHREPLDFLLAAHRSVQVQSHPCLHVMVADGHPHPGLASAAIDHVVLPRSHGDIGSTPRLVGALHAIGLGCDAVAFLDADNQYQPHHIADLLERQRQSGALFLSSSRLICDLELQPLAPCPLTDPERFIDTNCMLFMRGSFHLLSQWVLMPPYAHLIGDRVMLEHVITSGLPRLHSAAPSVLYRARKAGLYRQLGLPVPAGVDPRPDYEAALRQWRREHPQSRLEL